MDKEQRRLSIAVGRNTRHFRKARSLTQTQLAELIGTKQANVARLEHGKVDNFTTDYLHKLAEVLGITIGTLIRYRSKDKV